MSEHDMSEPAAEQLARAGHHAVNPAGGMQAWVADGLLCVTDDGSPATVA